MRGIRRSGCDLLLLSPCLCSPPAPHPTPRLFPSLWMFQSPSFLLLSLASTSRLHSQIDLSLPPREGRVAVGGVGWEELQRGHVCILCIMRTFVSICLKMFFFFWTALSGWGWRVFKKEKKHPKRPRLLFRSRRDGAALRSIHRSGCQCWSKQEEEKKEKKKRKDRKRIVKN